MEILFNINKNTFKYHVFAPMGWFQLELTYFYYLFIEQCSHIISFRVITQTNTLISDRIEVKQVCVVRYSNWWTWAYRTATSNHVQYWTEVIYQLWYNMPIRGFIILKCLVFKILKKKHALIPTRAKRYVDVRLALGLGCCAMLLLTMSVWICS